MAVSWGIRTVLSALLMVSFPLQALSAVAVVESSPLSLTIPVLSVPPQLTLDFAATPWTKAAKVDLGYDRLTHAPSSEPTNAYVWTDGKYLFVGFDATQTRSSLVMNQHSNNVGVDTDDEVKISLWPGGRNGFNYQFIATPAGTKYQYSTENTNYEPTWDVITKTRSNGFSVAMRIPLNVMRGSHPHDWLVQFTRWEVTTGSLYAWSGGENFQGTTDVNYARSLVGMPTVAATKPKPRVAIYGLAAVNGASIGGSTSRMGVDVAVPITQGTSFIGTFHPDFSNVEADQQTISPTAFRRYYSETRPFFTQGSSFYNYYECDACPNEQSLYTPAIPTPRNGYAVEGHEGPFSFGAFDAVADDRNDAAQSLVMKTRPGTFYISAQRVAVNTDTGVHDYTEQFATKLDDLKHWFAYGNYGTENGSLITDPSQAKFYEVGGGHYGPFSFIGGGIRRIGSQYNPYDGFFSNTAIAGWSLFTNHNWYPNAGFFKQINANAYIDRYHDTTGLGPNLTDQNLGIDVVTRKLWEFVANTGSSYFLTNGIYSPITQETTSITYHSGTATPTQLSLSTGIFGDGRVNAWNRITTFKAGSRTLITLQVYNTQQFLPTVTYTQWLERFSVAFAQGPDASLAIGLRRTHGLGPLLGTSQDTSCAINCWNISLAYHKRFGFNELYVAYGDPSTLTTTPQFLVKLIHYVGAEKGT
jgi:hypothetical protein